MRASSSAFRASGVFGRHRLCRVLGDGGSRVRQRVDQLVGRHVAILGLADEFG